MKLERTQDTLKISGQLNMMQLTKEEIHQFQDALDDQTKYLDFGGVTTADSSSISLILCALRQHKIELKNLPSSVQLLIDLYELDSMGKEK